jgi:hypothetical protein
MAFRMNATGFSRFFNQRRGYGRRGYRARGRRAQGGFFSSPIGRVGLGGLAFFAARRFLGRNRQAQA